MKRVRFRGGHGWAVGRPSLGLSLLAGSALALVGACAADADGAGGAPGVVATPGAGGGVPGVSTPPSTPGAAPVATPGGSAPTELLEILPCFRQERATQSACADDFVGAYTAADMSLDTAALLQEMEATRPMDETFEALCHPIAHAIGRWTFEETGSVPAAFDVCDASCHNGCYHGVMERVFLPEDATSDHATLEQVQDAAPKVCADSEFDDPSRTLLFQCFHGLGHGIVFSLAYDLEASIETCGMVVGSIHQSECRGGAFMENIYPIDPALRDIDRDDPHYPCNKFEGQVQGECYQMQTSLWTEFGMDDETMARTCMEAGDGTEMHNSVLQCMTSIGRDLSDNVRAGRSERVRGVCEDTLESDTHSWYCIRGTVAALIDNTSDGRYAVPFCAEFKSPTLQEDCYSISQNHLEYALAYTHEQWNEQCALYAGDQVAACEAVHPAAP